MLSGKDIDIKIHRDKTKLKSQPHPETIVIVQLRITGVSRYDVETCQEAIDSRCVEMVTNLLDRVYGQDESSKLYIETMTKISQFAVWPDERNTKDMEDAIKRLVEGSRPKVLDIMKDIERKETSS